MRALVLMALITGALASPAAAATLVNPANASPIGWVQYQLTAGHTYVFTTSAPAPGTGDTVLRLVWGFDERQAAMNDDRAAGDRMSQITFTVPANTTGTYHVFVLAKPGTAPGSCTLTVTNNGAPMNTRTVSFGGTTIDVPVATAPDFYQMEAVLLPNGARDTTLLGIDGTDRIIEIDEDSGVGLAAHVARAGIVKVVVGAPAGMNGNTIVYINDAAIHDNDCDGVGRELERELGTCDLSTFTGCSQVFDLKDSDRDGLEDAAEIYGIDSSPPQQLARWGADPRHKDVFLELDWYTPFYATRPIDESMMLAIHDALGAAPGNQILNLDGTNGIAVHIDAGFDPVATNLKTVYGAWGGGGPTPNKPVSVNRDPARTGVFIHGLLANGGVGQTPGDNFTASVGVPGSGITAVQTLLEELGHCLNLNHEGYKLYNWGLNCSPIYKSVMSYSKRAFGPIGYSNKTPYGSVTLNPTHLCEQAGLGGAPVSHLPFYGLSTMGPGIDWNNDGLYDDCNHPVRAAVNWAPGPGCDTQDDSAEPHLDRGAAAGQSPSLAHARDWMYLFYILGNKITYRRGSMPSSNHDAGCPRGDHPVIGAPACTDWLPPQTSPVSLGQARVTSVHAFAFGNTLYVGFTDDLHLEAQVFRVPVLADGSLGTWSAIERIAGSRTINAPDFQIVLVDPSRYAQATRVVMATWSDTVSNTARWSYELGGHFIGDLPMLDAAGAAIGNRGSSPTPVFWGDPAGTYGNQNQTWMALPDGNANLAVYRYDPIIDAWRNMTAQVADNAGLTDVIPNKIGFAFRPLLDGAGNVMDRRKGDFFLAYKQGPGQSVVQLRVSAVVTAIDRPDLKLVFKQNRSGRFGGSYFTLDAIEGEMDLYTDPDFPYLKGVCNQFERAAGESVAGPHLTFLPWADGVFDLDLYQGSDFEVMERGICLAIRNGDPAVCGPPNTFGY